MLRALEDLSAKERTMYELHHRKDQVMTVCKVALANLGMWVLFVQASKRSMSLALLLPNRYTHVERIVG